MWQDVGMTIGRGKRPRDASQLAKFIVDLSTGQIPAPDPHKGKDPAAIERGRVGGIKGGRVRAQRLSDEKKRSIAKSGATARWHRKEKADSGTEA